jgi:hypothetical protein
MDSGRLFALYSEVLTEIEGLISDLRDTADQFLAYGRVDRLPEALQQRVSEMRRTPIVRATPPRKRPCRKSPPGAEKSADEFRHDGFAHIEMIPRGRDVQVVIPGMEPALISPEAAVALQALAEPLELADGKRVAFKSVPELARRIAELSGSQLKAHSVVSTVSRLRKALRQRALIEKRSDKRLPLAYRFPLLARGRIIKHPPDFPAIGAATDGDR